MTAEQLNQLKFPIGPFNAGPNIPQSELDEMINDIASAPAAYRAVAKNLSENDLSKTYREGAWNVQQLVNHVADIQMLHFYRMKSALTEADYQNVTVVNADAWAQTFDGRTSPIADSLDMFEAITKRYLWLIKSLDEKQKAITYYHPIRKTKLNQKQAIAMTAWHVKHHLAHIRVALVG